MFWSSQSARSESSNLGGKVLFTSFGWKVKTIERLRLSNMQIQFVVVVVVVVVVVDLGMSLNKKLSLLGESSKVPGFLV